MNIELSTGLDYFWQWDTNTKLKIPDEIPEAHFRFDNKVATIEVEDGWVKIPDELMQKRQDIEVWTYDKEHTMDFGRIECHRRPKPDTYVYTPTEIKRWDDLDERIKALEENNTAVLYTEQELTEEQKAQARENIGAELSPYSWPAVTYTYEPYTGYPTTRTIYLARGILNPVNWESASDELKTAWIDFNRIYLNGFISKAKEDRIQNLANIYLLCQEGVFGEDFLVDGSNKRTTICANVGDQYGSNVVFSTLYIDSYTSKGKDYLTVVYNSPSKSSQSARYDPHNKSILLWQESKHPICWSYDEGQEPLFTQVLMKTAPTKDMHIATKKYVDDKTIAPTSNDSLELLAETGFITPTHQDGVIYTAQTGEIYVI